MIDLIGLVNIIHLIQNLITSLISLKCKFLPDLDIVANYLDLLSNYSK